MNVSKKTKQQAMWTKGGVIYMEEPERLARRCRTMNCSLVIGRMVGDFF
jgi:hypothetical protein